MRVLLVDDHPIVRAGLRRLLAAEPGVEICEAADGRAALTAFREQQPDLVVLDLNLPGIGGLELVARLKAADPRARILILSMHEDLIYVTHALQAGAAGYVSKRAPPEEIVSAIRRVGAGLTYVEHDIAEEMVFANINRSPDPLQSLSVRDLEILRLLAEGRGLSQIADVIGISYKTAANSCSQLKAKLGATSTAHLIRIALHAKMTRQDADLSLPSRVDPAKPSDPVRR